MNSLYRITNKIYRMSYYDICDRFEFLGEGIGRAVFSINNKYVIKVAKGSEGYYQNRVEYYVYTNCSGRLKKYLCPIIWFRPRMILMPKAIQLSNLVQGKFISLSEIFSDQKAESEILYMAKRFFLFEEDIVSTSSWGIINNRAVLIDYGCTSEEGDVFYDRLFF
jgi:hypothetical protein